MTEDAAQRSPSTLLRAVSFSNGRWTFYEVVKVELGEGITSELGLHVGKKVESTGFIQQGTGTVKQVDITPALNIKKGILGWHHP